MDGYGSHTMVPSVLQKLRNRKIVCLSMPSHTSHALQPLDVSCFRPTKYFWSWSLRYITGIGKICDITMYQAPYYFEVALLNGCTLRTIQNGFRTTGLYPFNPNWAEDNKDKFALAETLDIDKMNAKISAPDADLSFSHSYQLFEKRSENLGKAFEEFGANIQDQFPQLYNSVKEMLDSRVVQGSKLKEAALVFNLPENTKVKKVGQARLNVIGETFGAPRVLNSTERIQKLIEYRKVAQAHNRERQQKIADDKAKSAAKKARIAQQKRALAEKHGPVFVWLKVKNFCPQDETKINRTHMQAAFLNMREQITKAVRAGGDNINKSTGMNTMIDLFVKQIDKNVNVIINCWNMNPLLFLRQACGTSHKCSHMYLNKCTKNNKLGTFLQKNPLCTVLRMEGSDDYGLHTLQPTYAVSLAMQLLQYLHVSHSKTWYNSTQQFSCY